MNIFTEAPEEVKLFELKNKVTKLVTEYLPDNTKRWSFYESEKDKEPVFVFESYFDMNFFKK